MATLRVRVLHRAVIYVAGVAVALVVVSPASSTFPGLNGNIAFTSYAYRVGFTAVDVTGVAAVDLSGGVVFYSPYSGPDISAPAWSPDGRWLAFDQSIGTDPGIYVVDAWGGHLRRLTHSGADEEPSWAPSGDQIAYRGRGGIWVINADGTGAHRILDRGTGPSWSPDGEAIAFDDFGISLMRPDGSDVREVLPDGYDPSWSPDGQWLTYAYENFDLATGEIWIARRDGSEAHPITSGESDGAPVWSPDAKWIAFSRQNFRRDANIHLVRTDGSGLRRLTSGYGEVVADWQPLPCTQIGTSGPDLLVGTAAKDILCGQGGSDTLRAVGGDDILVGSGGNDLLTAAGRALLFGGSGRDTLVGGRSNDVLAGGFGADLERGGRGQDLLGGSGGADVIRGGPGADKLFGEAGRDALFGDDGADHLFGHDGQRDRLDGGPGPDCAIPDRVGIDILKSTLRCTLRQLQDLLR